MTETIIKVDNLSYEYPAHEEGAESYPALKNVSLEIHRGEFVAVLGHNGSGKSTLARCLNATFVPNSGTVIVNGMDTADEEKTLEIRKFVGMVFQNPDNQIVANVVEEDVAFAPENLGVPADEIRRRVDKALNLVGMYEYREHAPHQLSGGQKQRIAIAGVLAMDPACVVFDEPTSMLDPRGREDVNKIIKQLRGDENVTVILITHHMEETLECDRIFVMNEGEIALSGTPKEVFSQVEKLRAISMDTTETVSLAYELNQTGLFNLPLDSLSVDECAETITEAIRSKRGI